jgi:hypothetical protein
MPAMHVEHPPTSPFSHNQSHCADMPSLTESLCDAPCKRSLSVFRHARATFTIHSTTVCAIIYILAIGDIQALGNMQMNVPKDFCIAPCHGSPDRQIGRSLHQYLSATRRFQHFHEFFHACPPAVHSYILVHSLNRYIR